MDNMNGRLTVYFEKPFWVGVFERITDGKLYAAKIVFGAEPKDCEVYEFILKHYYDLKFSPAVAADAKEPKKNPKKIQRDIKKQVLNFGIGTKSQQALKLQQEQNKQKRISKKRERKEEKQKLLFELKQQKKKEKHRGH